MRPLPIRIRISLWYVLVLGLTLLLFSLLLHSYLRQRLTRDLDHLLLSRAEGIIDSIDAYWEAEKLQAIQDGAKNFPASKIGNENFARVTRFCLQEKSDDPVLLNITLQVFDASGKIIAAIKEFPGLSGGAGRLERPEGARRFDDLAIDSPGGGRMKVRSLVVPVREGGRLAYLVRVISPFSEINHVLGSLRLAMALLLPLLLLTAGFAGALLAKISLRPVNAIIDTVSRIHAGNLNLRVDVPAARDEIRRLAETFNQMLGSVDAAFSQQRRFIQDVSHELRTPLTILKGELEVSLKRARSAPEYESVLHSNLEEINRIARLVESLLTLARFDSRQVRMQVRELDLCSLLRRLVGDARLLAERKQVRLTLRQGCPLVIRGDEDHLLHLFFNILDNAVKYAGDGGHVQVEARLEDGAAVTTIADDGVGIEAAELPLIFERFHRGGGVRGLGGFGLGLSIARAIAEAHHGRIAIASLPGKGTTVTVTLPVAAS
jgi:two-component system OmpR family sensor kinase